MCHSLIVDYASLLYMPILSGISGFVLSSPTVGYRTAATFHTIGFSVKSKVKEVRRTARTTSAAQPVSEIHVENSRYHVITHSASSPRI